MIRRLILFAALVLRVRGNFIQEEDPANLFNVRYINGFPDETQVNNRQDQLRHLLIDLPNIFDISKCPNKCGAAEDYQHRPDGVYVSCVCVSDPDEMFHSDIKLTRVSKPVVNKIFGLPNSGDDIISRGLISQMDLIWPTSTSDDHVYIPYILASNFPEGHRTVIGEAFEQYEKETCIKFVERTTQRDYISLIYADGCWSMIGRNGGKQEASLGDGCQYIGVVEHELMHSLGFFHEQSRPDRDSFVRIVTSNIQNGRTRNFEKQQTSNIDSLGIGYDLGSVMHYNQYAFSTNGEKTIEVLNNYNKVKIGQRDGFSPLDIEQINKRYCPGRSPGGSFTTSTTRATTTSTTRRTTNAPYTTTTTRPAGCKNTEIDDDCEYWKNLGYCTKTFDEYMKQYCQASCGFCAKPVAEVCKDKIGTEKCFDFKRYCNHEQYGGWMRLQCSKRCGVCADEEVVTTTVKRTTTTPVVVQVTSGECGKPRITESSYNSYARIVGGVDSKPGTIPWQALLLFGPQNSAICGGSLISEHWILTAAHCVKLDYLKYYSAHLGLHEKKPSANSRSHIRVTFKNIIRHPDYNITTMENDIALMEINGKVKFTNYIQPICLASFEPPTLTGVTISGWGDTTSSEKGAVLQDNAKVLLKVELPLQSNEECNSWMSGVKAKVGKNMICAGFKEGQKDSCQGDSGGPLTYKRSYDQTYYQIGVVSWGLGCAEKKKPGVYTKVSAYRSWIYSHINI